MKLRTPLMIFLAVAAVGAGAGSDTPPEVPPVAVYSPIPLTPPEAAGTGLAPRARVVLHISRTGKVDAVRVSRLTPSSGHDAAFRSALERTLARWRFAPALRNGKPVESELDWQLEFRPAPARWGFMGTGLDDTIGVLGLLTDPDTEHRRKLYRVFTLPLEQQRARLDELEHTAMTCLDRERLAAARSPVAAVFTDHPGGAKTARAVLANVEATLGVVRDTLAPDWRLEPSSMALRVVVFARRSEYERFLDAVDGIRETVGVYIPPGLVAFHAELPANEQVLSVLIHESTHAFVGRFLLRPGTVLPRWLSEGLADYFSNSPVERHRLVPGKRRATQFYRAPMRIWRGETSAQLDLTRVRRAVIRGEGLSVEQLLQAGRDAFYGERISQYYAQSWLLVHFLRHGKPGWKDREFPTFLLYAAEGYDPRQAIRTVYGLGPRELEEAYREYVRRF